MQEAHDQHIAEMAAAAATAAATAAAAHAAAPAAPAAPAALRTHTVVSGDTLSAIGAHYHVSWQEIAKLNHIANPDLIYPGQVFQIPNS